MFHAERASLELKGHFTFLPISSTERSEVISQVQSRDFLKRLENISNHCKYSLAFSKRNASILMESKQGQNIAFWNSAKNKCTQNTCQ